MFMFHPWFGVAGILSGAVMVALAIVNNSATDELLKEANEKFIQSSSRLQSSLQTAEVVAAMGMSDDIARRQNQLNDEVIEKQTLASSNAGALNGITKSFRLIVQSLLRGSIFSPEPRDFSRHDDSRPALRQSTGPIDMLVGTWKSFSVASAQYSRLRELLNGIPPEKYRMKLPEPEGNYLWSRLLSSLQAHEFR